MRILFLHKHLVTGGIERTLLSYLPLMNSLNHHISLLLTYDVSFNNNSLQTALSDNQESSFIFGNKISRMFLHLKENKRKSILHKLAYELGRLYIEKKTFLHIKKQVNQREYDLIIDFSGVLDKFANKNKIRIPIIRWLHSQTDVIDCINKPTRFNTYQHIIAINNAMREQIYAQTPLQRNKISVITNPIILPEIIEKSLNTDIEIKDKDYLLVVARLVAGKGILELLDIYYKLKQQGIRNKLYIVGDGEQRTEIMNKVSSLGLENECILLGEKTNPYPCFKYAKLFTFTSESEGLGMSILESMALGVPVIAMDCPTGPKEILGKNSEYGKLIPLHDQETFCRAVIELLNNPEAYQYYSQKSLERATEFSGESVKDKLQDLFVKVSGENINGIPKP